MHFAFTDEQKLLEEAAAKFLENEYPFATRRRLAESDAGFSREHWAKFAELGWLGLGIPEADGGYGGGAVETAIVMEALGRALALEPYLANVILGGAALRHGGNEAQRALLRQLAAGELQLAVAFAERQSRYALGDVALAARPRGEGYVLTGAKSVVFHGASADRLVVTARTAGEPRDPEGITLFLVAPSAPGVSVRGYRTVDGLRAAEVAFEGVPARREDVLGEPGRGLPLAERIIDAGIVAVCAEAVGIMARMHAMTLEYLRGRRQFGQPLASFQALQHRVVDMFVAGELARSMAYMAAVKLEAPDRAERRRAVSAAKVQTGRAGRLVGQESIQLHGGMGMTDEMAIGHYFKRLTMIDRTFGDADHHLALLAGNAEGL